MSTAPMRRVMMPGPGTKRRKIPAAASKMPAVMRSAFERHRCETFGAAGTVAGTGGRVSLL